MGSLSASDIIELVVLLLAVGAAAGFLSGLFGIGGGAILVPIFYECFRVVDIPIDVRMPLCIGTSLAIIVPSSIRSFYSQRARGAVDMGVLRRWSLPMVTGVIIGSLIARYAPEQLFKIVFVLVEWVAAFRLLVGRETRRLGRDLPSGALMTMYGFGSGLLSTLMGIGGASSRTSL